MLGCLFKINRSVELTVKYSNWTVSMHKKKLNHWGFLLRTPTCFVWGIWWLKSC